MTLNDRLGYFRSQFENSERAKDYISGRGLSDSTVDDLSIGYCPEDCHSELTKFANRVIFPIFDLNQEPIAFGGRLLSGEGPKYYNSPTSEVYEKSKVLYNLNAAQDFILKSGHAIVVEGYMDVAMMWNDGFRNVVATCGTAFTRYHLRLLKRFCDSVILVFDGDKAGMQSAEAACNSLSAECFPIHVVTLPSGYDPDDYIKEYGAMDLIGLIRDAKEAKQEASRKR